MISDYTPSKKGESDDGSQKGEDDGQQDGLRTPFKLNLQFNARDHAFSTQFSKDYNNDNLRSVSEESSDKGSTKNEDTGQVGSEMKVSIHRVKNTTDLVLINKEDTFTEIAENQLKVDEDLNSISDDDQFGQKWNSQIHEFTGESTILFQKPAVLSGSRHVRGNEVS